MGDWQDDQERLLGYIAAGSALLFAITIVAVLLIQTIGPALGLRVGVISDVALGTLVAAVVTLTTSLGVREYVKRLRNGK